MPNPWLTLATFVADSSGLGLPARTEIPALALSHALMSLLLVWASHRPCSRAFASASSTSVENRLMTRKKVRQTVNSDESPGGTIDKASASSAGYKARRGGSPGGTLKLGSAVLRNHPADPADPSDKSLGY